MNWHLIQTLALTEMRPRLRRLSSLVALLITVAITWITIPDPSGGQTLMAIQEHRVFYTSSALAFGSAVTAGLLLGLGSFYLVRGRIGEDLRSGIGAVIGATPATNGAFLFARWLGGIAYLASLVLAFGLTMLVLHAVRGEGAIEPSIYASTYLVVLAPVLVFGCSCAILFDSVPLLMGKGGDVLYFFMWVLLMAFDVTAVESLRGGGDAGWIQLVDFSGLATAALHMERTMGTSHFAVGASSFNAALAPVTLPALNWELATFLRRLCASVVAMLPLALAALLFHRFSPDRVKAGGARRSRSPLAMLNRLARPFARLVHPLFGLAARWPGLSGQVLADMALTLHSAPLFLPAWLGLSLWALLAPPALLGGILAAAVTVWGVFCAAIATRDHEAVLQPMTAAIVGGAQRRFWRHQIVTWIFGLLCVTPVALRWLPEQPLHALAAWSGVTALAALANGLGYTSRTLRTFLAPFLFAIYVMLNVRDNPWVNFVGANGLVALEPMLWHAAIGALVLAGAWYWERRRALA